MPTLEKQILDHLGHWIRKEKYQPFPEEQECIKAYDRTPIYYTVGNFLLWGSVAVLTIDFRSLLYGDAPITKPSTTTPSPAAVTPTPPTTCPVSPNPHKPLSTSPAYPSLPTTQAPKPRFVTPRWLSIWGVAAVTAGAFATTYYSAKLASRSCIQCFIDVEDKKSQLYLTTRQLLKEHHPDAQYYFKREKRAENQ